MLNSTVKCFYLRRIFARLSQLSGADSGFDGISEAQGARRGAVGLVNKPQKNSRKRRTIRFSSLITCS